MAGKLDGQSLRVPVPDGSFTDPALALPRGCVIGGYVYRNDPTSAFYGAYIFADYQNNKLSALRLNPAKTGVSEWK